MPNFTNADVEKSMEDVSKVERPTEEKFEELFAE